MDVYNKPQHEKQFNISHDKSRISEKFDYSCWRYRKSLQLLMLGFKPRAPWISEPNLLAIQCISVKDNSVNLMVVLHEKLNMTVGSILHCTQNIHQSGPKLRANLL